LGASTTSATRLGTSNGHGTGKLGQPAVNVLGHLLALTALVRLADALPLEDTSASIAVGIHGTLEAVAAPAKDIVTVGTISGIVAIRPHEGLRAVLRPDGRVVELARVPDDLVEQLRDLDGVRGRAGSAALESAGRRIGD